MDRAAKLRAFFAWYVVRRAGAADPRIEHAFGAVPREPFAGPPPWHILPLGPWSAGEMTANGYLRTPDGDPAFLYQDVLVALDPARGINIGEPSLHARCLDALALQPGEAVLHVGAGSGYYSAIIATLIGPEGHVFAYEIDPDLAARAAGNLAAWPWVELRARSGIADDLPTVDAVYVSAGITQPSRAWLQALRPGGRLLFPLQQDHGAGGMLLARKPAGGGTAWAARFVSRASFIGCRGPQDAAQGRRLAAAFSRGGWQEVRSLRLDDAPDESCWTRGQGWWLSTEAT